MKNFANSATIKSFQVGNWAFFGIMVFVNYLANALPINGKNTGELSDQYPNLFVPAPLTFAIWGMIYLLVLGFCIRQSKGLLEVRPDSATTTLVSYVGPFFMISCALNALWILVWHYQYQVVSLLVMLGLLASLLIINFRIDSIVSSFSPFSRFLTKAPFGLYLGWICVATVANSTAALVHYGWTGAGQGEVFWACAMIVVAAVIVCFTLFKITNFYVGLAVIWALAGIINARLQAEVYHPSIVWTAVVSIGVVLITTLVVMAKVLFQKPQDIIR